MKTRHLLACGIVAGPLFLAVWAIQAIVRDGFDPGRHPISLLSLGDARVARELSEQLEPGVRAAGHRHRDRVVERHHGVVGGSPQQLVQGHDLRPVGRLGARGLVVDRGDRRLELVRAGRTELQRLADQRDALVDGRAVPAAAVLLGERHERAVGRGARRPPRVG